MDNLTYSTLKEKYNNSITGAFQQLVINAMYKTIDMRLMRYDMIKDNEKLHEIDDNYYVTAHVKGLNCCLVYYNTHLILVVKRYLKPKLADVDFDLVDMFIIGRCDDVEYHPITVYDGRVISNENLGLQYMIYDCHVYGGKTVTNRDIADKIRMCKPVSIDNFGIDYAPYYELKDINSLVYDYIRKSRKRIDGIIFVPRKTKTLLIYLNEQDITALRRHQNNTKLINHPSTSINTIASPSRIAGTGQVADMLWLKKTLKSDVYEVYRDSVADGNKMGIAHIPDIATSHYCKSLSDENHIFRIKCAYDTRYDKWKPLMDDN